MPPASPTFEYDGESALTFAAPYPVVFSLVERALRDCDVKIKDPSPDEKRISGKMRYGVNPFGMTIVATFTNVASVIRVELTAAFTDAFDTFGACKKKVRQISRRLADMARAEFSGGMSTPSDSLPPPPAGAGYLGKAIVGLCLSVAGIFVGPVSIVGLILSGVALTGTTTSSSQSGKVIAVLGTVVGFFALIGWIFMLLR